MEGVMMKYYVETLDQTSLQAALDSISGPGVFKTARDKLSDGTRPLYYQVADTVPSEWITQASTIAKQLDQQYLENLRTDLLSDLLRAGLKSRQRQPDCVYTVADQTQAQSWLNNITDPVPLVVQLRSLSQKISNRSAAEQIVSSYTQYLNYPNLVDQMVLQGQINIQAADLVRSAKAAYQQTVEALAEIENTDYGLS